MACLRDACTDASIGTNDCIDATADVSIDDINDISTDACTSDGNNASLDTSANASVDASTGISIVQVAEVVVAQLSVRSRLPQTSLGGPAQADSRRESLLG